MIEADIAYLKAQVKVQHDATQHLLEQATAYKNRMDEAMSRIRRLETRDAQVRTLLHAPPVPPVLFSEAALRTVPDAPKPAVPAKTPKSVCLTKEMLQDGLVLFLDCDPEDPIRILIRDRDSYFASNSRFRITCRRVEEAPGLYYTAINRGPFGSLGVLWHEVWKPGYPGDKPWDE